MDKITLQKNVTDILKLLDHIDPSKVTLEAKLTSDLGLDDLDKVEAVMAIEDEFDVSISEEEATKIVAVSDIVELLQIKLNVTG